VHVVAVVGEVGAVAAVDPAAVDEQRLDAVGKLDSLDLLPVEVQLRDASRDPVEQ
jgi:hypothetical protein